MPDAVLPNQGLYTAAPFQVINPSGVGADQSIQGITAVGEGNRQRALEAQMASARNKHDADQREKDRMAAAEQADKNRNLQRELAEKEQGLAQRQLDIEEKRYRDEQFYKRFTEEKSNALNQLNATREELERQRRDALEQADVDRMNQLEEQLDALDKRKNDLDRNLTGIEMINALRDQSLDPKRLAEAFNALVMQKDATTKLLERAEMDVPGLLGRAGKKPAALKGEDAGASLTGAYEIQRSRDQIEQGGLTGWEELTEWMSPMVVGGMQDNQKYKQMMADRGSDPGAASFVASQLNGAFQKLQQATEATDIKSRQVLLSEAVKTIRDLEDMGADSQTLGGILGYVKRVNSGSGTAARAQAASLATQVEDTIQKRGFSKEAEGQTQGDLLDRMLTMLGSQRTTRTGADKTPREGRLLDYGDGYFHFDAKSKDQDPNWTRTEAIKAMAAVAGYDNWEEMAGEIARTGVSGVMDIDERIKKMPPEYQKFVRDQFEQISELAYRRRKEQGVLGVKQTAAQLREEQKNLELERSSTKRRISSEGAAKKGAISKEFGEKRKSAEDEYRRQQSESAKRWLDKSGGESSNEESDKKKKKDHRNRGEER